MQPSRFDSHITAVVVFLLLMLSSPIASHPIVFSKPLTIQRVMNLAYVNSDYSAGGFEIKSDLPPAGSAGLTLDNVRMTPRETSDRLPAGMRFISKERDPLDPGTGIVGEPAVGSSGLYKLEFDAVDLSGRYDDTTFTYFLPVHEDGALLALHTSHFPDSDHLPSGIEGGGYPAFPLIATGGTPPFNWTATRGLPGGMRVENGDGKPRSAVITGTPAVGSAGMYTITFVVADSSPVPVRLESPPIILVIEEALAITTTDLPYAFEGERYSSALQAEHGVEPYRRWDLDGFGVGDPPVGIEVTREGIVSGRPEVGSSGTYNFTVFVVDSEGTTAYANVTMRVRLPLAITTIGLPETTEGNLYGVTLEAANAVGDVTWNADGLPDGMFFTVDGDIGGVALPGTWVDSPYRVTLSASDGDAPPVEADDVTFDLVVHPPGPLEIQTKTFPSVTEGERFDALLNVRGGTFPYSWSVSGAPEGFEITVRGAAITLTGVPPVGSAGQGLVTISVIDSSVPVEYETSQKVMLRIDPAPGQRDSELRVLTTSLPAATSTVFYDPVLLEAEGGTPNDQPGQPDYTFTASGLPTGLIVEYDARIDAWLLFGTTEISKPGTFDVTITATDATGATASVIAKLIAYTLPREQQDVSASDGGVVMDVPLADSAAGGALCSLAETPNPSGIPLPIVLMVAGLIALGSARRRELCRRTPSR